VRITPVTGGVQPVIRIGQPGPGEASGASADNPRLCVDQEAQAPFKILVRERYGKINVVRQLGHDCLPQLRDVDISNLVLRHLGNGFRTQDLGAVEDSATHDHLEEGEIVGTRSNKDRRLRCRIPDP